MTLALFMIGIDCRLSLSVISSSGMFANTYFVAVICCVLFGVGMGGVAAYMSVIYVEGLGIEAIDVRPLIFN